MAMESLWEVWHVDEYRDGAVYKTSKQREVWLPLGCDRDDKTVTGLADDEMLVPVSTARTERGEDYRRV